MVVKLLTTNSGLSYRFVEFEWSECLAELFLHFELAFIDFCDAAERITIEFSCWPENARLCFGFFFSNFLELLSFDPDSL